MTLYRGTIQLADADRGVQARIEAATPLHPSESMERLVLRLLAYTLLHQPGLRMRPGGVSDGETPELGVYDDTGRLRHWIEVGTPNRARLQKAARTHPVTVVTHQGLLPRWQRLHHGRLPQLSGGTLILEAPLVETLAATLPRHFGWQATVSGDTLYLDDGQTTRISTLTRY